MSIQDEEHVETNRKNAHALYAIRLGGGELNEEDKHPFQTPIVARHQVDAVVGSVQCILPLISSYKHAGKKVYVANHKADAGLGYVKYPHPLVASPFVPNCFEARLQCQGPRDESVVR